MKALTIPQFIPRKYHHEIRCLIEEQHKQTIRTILNNVELNDKCYLEIANMIPGMATCPNSILKILSGGISKKVLEIRTKKVTIS